MSPVGTLIDVSMASYRRPINIRAKSCKFTTLCFLETIQPTVVSQEETPSFSIVGNQRRNAMFPLGTLMNVLL
jgi:hypothetical protein